MKVVMADDENLIRSGLRSMLSELGLPLEIAGEARNGEELAALVEQVAPDLVFADIRMPRLTGLEALRQVKDKAPYTQWVMLTGFADFEYAREALRLGAIQYLLKPVTPEDLSACVAEAFKKHRHHITLSNRIFESDIVSTLQDARDADDFDAQHLLDRFRFKGTVYCFDSFVEEQEKVLLRKRFASNLQHAADELMTSRCVRYGFATLPSGHLALITAWDSRTHSAGPAMIERFERAADEAIGRSDNGQFAVTALRTEACEQFGAMLEQLSEFGKWSAMRNLLTLGNVHSVANLAAAACNPELAELSHRLDAVCRLFVDKDFVPYTQELALLEKALSAKLFEDRGMLRTLCDYLHYSIGCKLHALRDRTAWFAALRSYGETMLIERVHEKKLQGDLIQQVIRHVRDRYMENIGIGQIAADLNVTPNYLSTLFHKRCGMTFMKFLTETRMLKAKELLVSDPNVKVQQVAEWVGYYSTRHFTKLFTDYFGYYPSEVREKSGDIPGCGASQKAGSGLSS